MKSEEEEEIVGGWVVIAEAACASLSTMFAGGYEPTDLVNIRSSRWSGSGWRCVLLHIGVGG